jgi:hypothetical protein
MAAQHGHLANMLVLDGDDVLGERAAAAILDTAPFVAKNALAQSRRLGSARIAKADFDVRGPAASSRCRSPRTWLPAITENPHPRSLEFPTLSR